MGTGTDRWAKMGYVNRVKRTDTKHTHLAKHSASHRLPSGSKVLVKGSSK